MSTRKLISAAVQRQVLADYLSGEQGTVIGRRYGVSRGYAANLLRRRGYLSPHKLRTGRMWDRAREVASA